jgi:uncharacterized protein YukE
MNDPSPVNVELSIALPLGVVANQLMKVEADLRLLNAKTSAYASQSFSGAAGQVAARLEKINEALEVIRGLVSEIENDIQTAGTRSRKARTDRDD